MGKHHTFISVLKLFNCGKVSYLISSEQNGFCSECYIYLCENSSAWKFYWLYFSWVRNKSLMFGYVETTWNLYISNTSDHGLLYNRPYSNTISFLCNLVCLFSSKYSSKSHGSSSYRKAYSWMLSNYMHYLSIKK